MAAFLVPIHLILFTLVIPLGWVAAPETAGLAELAQHPIAKVYLFCFVGGCLFHWSHRFRYTVIDLGMHGARGLVAFLCYGSAIAGSAAASA